MSIESSDRSPDIYEKLLWIEHEHERIDFEAIKYKRKSTPSQPRFSIEEESAEYSEILHRPPNKTSKSLMTANG